METSRQEKVARQLQKELGEIFLLFARRHTGTLITVTEVRVTPDLSAANVFLSIFPNAKQDEMMAQINANTPNLRFELGNRMRNQLRIIPELAFTLDQSEEKLAHIDELLKK